MTLIFHCYFLGLKCSILTLINCAKSNFAKRRYISTHLWKCHRHNQSCLSCWCLQCAQWVGDGVCQSISAAFPPSHSAAAVHAGRTKCWQHAALHPSPASDTTVCHSQTFSTMHHHDHTMNGLSGSVTAVIQTAIKTQHQLFTVHCISLP